jgi:hypothetical protein
MVSNIDPPSGDMQLNPMHPFPSSFETERIINYIDVCDIEHDQHEHDTKQHAKMCFIVGLFPLGTVVSISIFCFIEFISVVSQNRDTTLISLVGNPLPQTFFYVCVVGSIGDFAIRSSGVMASKYHPRMYQLSSILIALVSLILLILMSEVPTIYEFEPEAVSKPIDRGNCSLINEISPFFTDICPTYNPQHLVFVPTAMFSNSDTTYNEPLDQAKKTIEYVKQLQQFKPLMAAIDFQDFPHTSKLTTDFRCIELFMDVGCEMAFERCRYDCAAGGSCSIWITVQKWIDCGRNICSQTKGCDVSIDFSAQKIKQFMDAFLTLLEMGFANLATTAQGLIQNIHKTTVAFRDKKEYNRVMSNECRHWQTALVRESNPNITIPTATNDLSCNPNITKIVLPGNETIIDNTIPMAVVFLLFFTIVVFFSHLHASGDSSGHFVLHIQLSGMFRFACDWSLMFQ